MPSKKAKALYKTPIAKELRRIGRAAAKALEQKKTWAVYVDSFTYGRHTTYKTFFRVGVQYFILAKTDDPDEGKQHCQNIAKMFLIALNNIGVQTEKRKRR